jgi:hypothetical protein
MYPMQQPPQEEHIVLAYIKVVAIVATICFMWIIFNEVVMRMDVAILPFIGGPATGIVSFIIICWRLAPFIILAGVFGWALYRTFKHEPYQQYGGI